MKNFPIVLNVMIASQRARQIGSGAPLTVERDNDKKTVISLRELAEETVSTEKQGRAYYRISKIFAAGRRGRSC